MPANYKNGESLRVIFHAEGKQLQLTMTPFPPERSYFFGDRRILGAVSILKTTFMSGNLRAHLNSYLARNFRFF